MTNGAKRRNAYVSAVIFGTGLLLITLTGGGWIWGLIASFFFISSLHELATIGFTSRADNEN